MQIVRFVAAALLAYLLGQILAARPVFAAEQPIHVADPWSLQAYSREMFDEKRASDSALRASHALIMPLYIPPLNILSLAYFKILGRVDRNISDPILQDCREEQSLEAKIACISIKVSAYAINIRRTKSGITFDGRTFCAISANLFARVYNSIGIPKSRADFLDASNEPPTLHVANVVSLTTPTGQVFTYVTDAGNLPGVLFPLSRPAIAYHTRGHGGKTEINTFPDIDFEHPGALEFHP